VKHARTFDVGSLVTKADLKADLAPFATKVDLAPFATKVDLAPFATKVELAETKAEIIKWMVSSIGIQTIVIIGAVIALVRVGTH
jgi:hypothetical protein